jgi:hypothetical protein
LSPSIHQERRNKNKQKPSPKSDTQEAATAPFQTIEEAWHAVSSDASKRGIKATINAIEVSQSKIQHQVEKKEKKNLHPSSVYASVCVCVCVCVCVSLSLSLSRSEVGNRCNAYEINGLEGKRNEENGQAPQQASYVESAFVKGAGGGQGVERPERVVQKHGAIAASRGH